MGIKGLKNIIKKYAINSLREINIKDLNGSTIAVDSSILLYKFRYLYQNNFLLGFNNIVKDFTSNNIKLIFIFEGTPPEAKKETIKKRVEHRNKLNERINELIKDSKISEEYIEDSENSDYEPFENSNNQTLEKIEKIKKNIIIVTKEHSNQVIHMLGYKNIPYFTAIGEAEEYCSFLQVNKVVDYVLTEDTDSLAFGATKVLFGNKINNYLLCDLNIVLQELQFNMDEFIDFCILCGCDYTPSIPKIGPVNALKIIQKYRSIDSFIKENENLKKYIIPENFNYLLARELFLQHKKYIVPEITLSSNEN